MVPGIVNCAAYRSGAVGKIRARGPSKEVVFESNPFAL